MKNTPRLAIAIGFTLILALAGCQGDRAPWTNMITENGMEDFTQMGGKALFEVSNGSITGTAVANTENSFLCTRQEYNDFILEFKILADTSVNSGVQIRSHAYMNGRVHGYQVEVDPTTRAWSGGIYDEARRKWLNDLSGNEAGQSAYKPGEWNHYRIEAIGNSFKTWINGVMCANLVDEADTSGYIAFQVHTVDVDKKPWTEGVQIQWKDIRILTSDLDRYMTMESDPVPVRTALLTNSLTVDEEDDGWEMLFDGSSMEKWRGVNKETFPEDGWTIEEGILKLNAEGDEKSSRAGDIVTIEKFSNFELSLEFKITPGANSGIKYYVTKYEAVSGSEGAVRGLEYQILDDDLHPDAKKGRDGNRTLASLYDLIPADSRKYVREPGMWNMAQIISRDNKVEHWLNGAKVLDYERGSEEFRKLVEISKYKIWENFGEAEAGHILLQEHGNNAAFRNIKIKRF